MPSRGDYGIYSKYRLEKQTVELQAEFAELKQYRNSLEQRVRMLHDGTLDKDMLDEQARKSLNLTKSDEGRHHAAIAKRCELTEIQLILKEINH